MDKWEKEEIFNNNLGLVYKVFFSNFKYCNNTHYKDDLIQEGMMELYRCIGSYQKNRGAAFSTFAYNNIYFRMLNYVETFIYQKKIVNKVVGNRKYKQVYEGAEIVSINKQYKNGGRSETEYSTLIDFIEADTNDFEELETKILVENVIDFAKRLENSSTNRTYEGIAKIVELRAKGLTSYQIQDLIGISRTTVITKLNRFYEYCKENFVA